MSVQSLPSRTAKANRAAPSSPAPSTRPQRSPRGRRTLKRREALAALLFVLPTLVIFVVFKFVPIFGAAAMSLTRYRLNGDVQFIGADNYTRLFADSRFWQSLGVTVSYVLIYVPLIIVISLACALLLNRLTKLTGIFRALLFIPYLSSFVLAGIVWNWIFASDGPLNAVITAAGGHPVLFLSGDQWLVLSCLAVVAVWKGFGYSMLIFLAGLKAQSVEVNEAAKMDGANPWQAFWHVTLPMLRPVLLFVLVIESIVGFQVFDTIYIMTGGGPAHASYSIIYFLFEEGFKFFDFGYAAAIGMVLFVIVLILALVQRRFLEPKEES